MDRNKAASLASEIISSDPPKERKERTAIWKVVKEKASKGSPDNPVSLEDMLTELILTFPDRDPRALRKSLKTLNGAKQRLQRENLRLKATQKGFWIEKQNVA